MKNGYMFFLNLGNITYIARILLVVCAVVFFTVDGFFQRLVVLGALVLCLLVGVIKAPSDKDVMRTVEFFRKRFKERLAESGHEHSMQSVRVLEAYKVKGKMKLRRVVGYDVVYPNLVSLALARADKDRLELYIDELCLLKRNDFRFTKRIIDASNISVSVRTDEEDADVMEITLRCEGYEEGITLIAKNDYHYREFMELVSSVLNI